MRNSRAVRQGQYTRSMPLNMPSDSYLNQFEVNTISAQSLFWARSYIWQFSDFSNLSGVDMENNSQFIDAINQDQHVTDDINRRCLSNYFQNMNPTLGAMACACCGRLDIPIPNEYLENSRNSNHSFAPPKDVIHFQTYNIHDPLFLPLHYTEIENEYYNSEVPHGNILNTPENRAKWNRYKSVISNYNRENEDGTFTRMHLYPELVTNNNQILICNICQPFLTDTNPKRPDISIAEHYDFGNVARITNPPMPKLSLLGEFVIQRVRVLSSALNFKMRAPNSNYNTFKGHCISFIDNNALICGQTMPDVEFVSKNVQITIEGPRDVITNNLVEGCLRNCGLLTVPADDIIDWLYLLKFVNPNYYDIDILSNDRVTQAVDNIRENLITYRIPLPFEENENSHISAQNISTRAAADFTRVEESENIGNNLENNNNTLENININEDLQTTNSFVMERFQNINSESAIASALNAVRDTINPNLNRGNIHNNSNNSNNNSSNSHNIPNLRLRRTSTNPLNDYLQQDTIQYQGFPTVFPLGQGIGHTRGPLHIKIRTFILKHFLRTAATNDRYLMFINNVKYRSDAAKCMSTYVRTERGTLQQFHDFVMNNNNLERINDAIRNPSSNDAKRILSEIAPFILITGGKIPYSPLERGTRAAAEVFAMCRYLGLPNLFYTIGFDEKRNSLIARIACYGKNEELRQYMSQQHVSSSDFWRFGNSIQNSNFYHWATLLPQEILENSSIIEHDIWRQEIADHIQQDSTAIALISYRMMTAFHECLLGVPRTQKRTNVNFSSLPPGIFGRPKGWFEVSECNSRELIHFHGLAWVGLPPWITQRCIINTNTARHIALLLQDIYHASASPILHAAKLLRKIINDNHYELHVRSSYHSPPSPDMFTMEEINQIGEASIVNQNGHTHFKTCEEGNRGPYECRCTYPRPTETGTLPRIIEPHIGIDGKSITTKITELYEINDENNYFMQVRNENDNLNFDEIFYELMYPGGHTHIIEYPIFRELLSLPLHEIFHNNVETHEKNILHKLYIRLVNTSTRIGIQPTEINISSSNEEIRHAIIDTLNKLKLGQLDHEHGKLTIHQHLRFLQAIANLNENIKEKFVNCFILQNALLGESNKCGIAALGCNFNTQPLISTESSLNAIWYIIDYITKESMDPYTLFSFLVAARNRMNNYEGQAPEGENPQDNDRPLRRLAQIIHNSIMGSVQISVQQCVLNIANIPSHNSSETYTFVFTTPAIRKIRTIFNQMNGNNNTDTTDRNIRLGLTDDIQLPRQEDEDIEEEEHENNEEQNEDNNADDDDYHIASRARLIEERNPFELLNAQEEINNINVSHGRSMRTTQGDIFVDAQDIHYFYRNSNKLCYLSLLEYSCIVHHTPMPTNIDNISTGRQRNLTTPFDIRYPLHDQFIQTLTSKLTCPILGSIGSVPCWPQFDQINNNTRRQQKTKKTIFAEYCLATLIPWPAPNYTYEQYGTNAYDVFTNIIRQLKRGNFLLQEDGHYHGPPGYDIQDNIITHDTQDFAAYQFSQQCLAKFIGSLARGLKRSKHFSRKAQSMWRGRFTQEWRHEDPEKILFPRQNLTNNYSSGQNDVHQMSEQEESNEALMVAIELLREQVDADSMDYLGVSNESATNVYLEEFKQYNNLLKNPTNNISLRPNTSIIQSNIPDLDNIPHINPDTLTTLFNVLKQDPINVTFINPQRPLINNTILESATFSLNRIINSPDPTVKKPNQQQEILLRQYADYIDRKRRGESPQPLRTFLHSAAGTGKSFFYEILSIVVHSIGYTMITSALTGVACTSITTIIPARTTASLYMYGIKPQHATPLSENKLNQARIMHHSNSIAICCVDEIGMGSCTILKVIDNRNRQIFEQPNSIFGGVCIIISGDFFQLPVIGELPIYSRCFHLHDRGCSQLEREGFELFQTFRIFQFDQQMRVEDPELLEIVQNFRQGNTNGLKNYIRNHIITLADYDRFGPPTLMISPGNKERLYLQLDMLLEFGRRTNEQVISWPIEAIFRNSTDASWEQSIRRMGDELFFQRFIQKNPQMICHFVKDCPIFLLVNDLNPLRGLANGTQGRLYSIHWKNEQIRNDALEYIRRHQHQPHVILPWNLAPSGITMIPIIKQEFVNAWEPNLTTVPNEIVLPIPIKRETVSITAGNKRFYAIAQKPMYEIGLMSTVHKAQGRTLEYLVFSLLKRVGPPTREDFFAFYVLLTRIKRGDNFRVIANPNDLDFLDNLKPPIELIAFLHGYDQNGNFHFNAATTEYERLQQLQSNITNSTINNSNITNNNRNPTSTRRTSRVHDNRNSNTTTITTTTNTTTTNSITTATTTTTITTTTTTTQISTATTNTNRNNNSSSNRRQRDQNNNNNNTRNVRRTRNNNNNTNTTSQTRNIGEQNIHENLENIVNNQDNIIRAANEVTDQQIIIDEQYPPITLPLAIQVRNSYKNLTGPVYMITNSCIYVPIIRAAQNLTNQNTDYDQIEVVRNLIGNQNFNNITLRLREIFTSLHINPENTGYNNDGYINDYKQILLLGLEERIIQMRQNNHITPLGQLLDSIIQTQLPIIQHLLTQNNIPLFINQH